MAVFTHRGPWDEHSRQSPALRFIEKYCNTIDSLDLDSTSASAFFSPNALFHDTKGDVYITGQHIWDWLKRVFLQFDSVLHEVVELRVVPELDGREVVYGEFVTHFRPRGAKREVTS